LQTSSCGYRLKQRESAFVWIAPDSRKINDDEVIFSALCGQFIGPMLVAKRTMRYASEKGEDDDGELLSIL